MNQVSPEKLLLLGKVMRPHGLDGRLRIYSYAQSPESFLDAGTVYIRPLNGNITGYKVLSVNPHKKIFIIKLSGLDSIETAEKFRGAEILIGKDTLKRDEDEFFWFELIGLDVYLDTGRHIGTLKNILPTVSNDIYVIGEGKSEVFIPAIKNIVKEIDMASRKMIIYQTEGLFD